MDAFRKYLLSNVYRAPDEPVADAVTDPPAGDTPAATDPPADPDPQADPPQPEPGKDHGNKGQTPWYMKRIAEETDRRQQVERDAQARIAAAQREASDAREMMERLQRGDAPAGDRAQPAPRTAAPPQQDFQQAVKSEAARQRLYDDTITVRNVGTETFPDFNNSLNILTALGATDDDFVLDVLAVDKANAHIILDKLAKDPEKAASLVGMDSKRRVAELTRISMAEQSKTAALAEPEKKDPPKPVSGAPKPKPALAAVSGPDEGADLSDEADDDKWSKAWDKRFKKTG